MDVFNQNSIYSERGFLFHRITFVQFWETIVYGATTLIPHCMCILMYVNVDR